MAEIDDTALAQLKEVYAFVDGIWKHPEARKKMQEAMKAKDPNYSIPELDAKDEVRAELAKEREARQALEADIKKDREERARQEQIAAFSREWEGQKAALRQQGYMDDGIKAIEEFAQKHAIPNLDVAEAYWRKLNPPQEVRAPINGNSWGLFDIPAEEADSQHATFMKRMLESHGDDSAALDAEIGATLTGLRSQRAR